MLFKVILNINFLMKCPPVILFLILPIFVQYFSAAASHCFSDDCSVCTTNCSQHLPPSAGANAVSSDQQLICTGAGLVMLCSHQDSGLQPRVCIGGRGEYQLSDSFFFIVFAFIYCMLVDTCKK